MSPVLIRPRRFADSRGWFSESWNADKFATIGIEVAFCQDNQSLSRSAAKLCSERAPARGFALPTQYAFSIWSVNPTAQAIENTHGEVGVFYWLRLLGSNQRHPR